MHKELLYLSLVFIFFSSVGFVLQGGFLAYPMAIVGIFLLGIYVGERKLFEEIKNCEKQIRNNR